MKNQDKHELLNGGIKSFNSELRLLGINLALEYNAATSVYKAKFVSKEGEHGNMEFVVDDNEPNPYVTIIWVWKNHRDQLLKTYPTPKGGIN